MFLSRQYVSWVIMLSISLSFIVIGFGGYAGKVLAVAFAPEIVTEKVS